VEERGSWPPLRGGTTPHGGPNLSGCNSERRYRLNKATSSNTDRQTDSDLARNAISLDPRSCGDVVSAWRQPRGARTRDAPRVILQSMCVRVPHVVVLPIATSASVLCPSNLHPKVTVLCRVNACWSNHPASHVWARGLPSDHPPIYPRVLSPVEHENGYARVNGDSGGKPPQGSAGSWCDDPKCVGFDWDANHTEGATVATNGCAVRL
jgi:hypothetical protein